jgi:hypothetical protein
MKNPISKTENYIQLITKEPLDLKGPFNILLRLIVLI